MSSPVCGSWWTSTCRNSSTGVNHDILIDRLRKRIDDAGVIRLVRAYLNSGIMDHGVVLAREEGTPQGGPLSPLLANVMLDEVDKELERRGHRFARYADDANVYVRSVKAGQRVMSLLRRCYARLHLVVNEGKSAVASVFGRKFLGYSLWVGRGGEVKRKVAEKPLQAYKQRIREQHGWCGAGTPFLYAGLERVLPASANPEGMARTR